MQEAFAREMGFVVYTGARVEGSMSAGELPIWFCLCCEESRRLFG